MAFQLPSGDVVRCQGLDIWRGDDGIARVLVTRPKLEGDDAEALLAGLAQLSDGRPLPLLVDIRPLRSISLSVRKIMASPEAGQRISHAAVVVSNAVNRMIGSFFLRLNHPPFEMRLFDDENEAWRWLGSETMPK